ncbi:MAG: 3-dehydroquinate synthase [Saprospirales bacterium]|nr:MAG: 3-dehydroquinate synthase [Saprospirales bacterium]
MKNIRLDEYSIYLDDIWNNFTDLIRDYHHIIVLTDINTRMYCLNEFKMLSGLKNFSSITIPDDSPALTKGKHKEARGEVSSYYIEQYKTLSTAGYIYDQLIDCGADRHSLMINLGGGVICDIGGFCASTYMRGMNFIQFPTTLLSQVDGSVGGKVGINYRSYKNLIGLFRNPIGVFVHDKFLDSLPEREVLSGFAEIMKHALILNYNLWTQIKEMEALKINQLMPLIEKSVVIKKQIVQTDPQESGKRKILNFGHTIGHALESCYLNNQRFITHGEAVAAGMVMECYLSMWHYGHSGEWLEEILGVFRKFYPKTEITDQLLEEMMENIKMDKKNKGGIPNFTFLLDVGNVEYDLTAPAKNIREAIIFYRDNY